MKEQPRNATQARLRQRPGNAGELHGRKRIRSQPDRCSGNVRERTVRCVIDPGIDLTRRPTPVVRKVLSLYLELESGPRARHGARCTTRGYMFCLRPIRESTSHVENRTHSKQHSSNVKHPLNTAPSRTLANCGWMTARRSATASPRGCGSCHGDGACPSSRRGDSRSRSASRSSSRS